MDPQLKNALIQCTNILYKGCSISTLSQLVQNTSVLTHLAIIVDPQCKVESKSHEEDLKIVCEVVNKYFNDIVDADQIMLRGEFEMGRLLCLLINLVLTEGEDERRRSAVQDVQRLPNDVQTQLMKMLKVICENREDEKLRTRLSEFICAGDIENDNSSSANNSPEPQDGSYLYGSPKESRSWRNKTVCSEAEVISRDSPIGRYLGSSQYLYKKVMVENSQLKKEINKKYNEQVEVVEHKIMDLREEKDQIGKENEHQRLKIRELEMICENLNKEIQRLSDSLAKKEEVEKRRDDEIKNLKADLVHSQIRMEEKHNTINDLREKNTGVEEEKLKNKQLLERLSEVECKHKSVTAEYANIKEASDRVLFQMEKMKLDHIDIVGHLKEEIARLERQNIPVQPSQETLAESIQIEQQIKNLQTDVQRLQGELRSSEESSREKTESHSKQVTQYMDQITSLLNQVQEQNQRSDGLTEKVGEMERKCSVLHRDLVSETDKSKLLQGQIEETTAQMEEKKQRIQLFIEEENSLKVKHESEIRNMQSDMDAKLMEQQQVLEDMKNDHRVVLEETKTKLAIEQGQYQQEIYKLEEVVSNQKKELMARMERISEHEKSINAKSDELNITMKTCADLRETVSKLQVDNNRLHEDNENKSMNIAELGHCRDEIEELKKEINGIKSEKILLEEQLVQVKSVKDEESSCFMKQNIQHMDQVSTMLKQINDKSEKNEALIAKVAALELQVKTLEEQLGLSEVQAKQAADEGIAKSSEIEGCQSMIHALNEERRQHDGRIDLLEKEKLSWMTIDDNNKNQINQLTDEVKRVQDIIEQKNLLISTYGEENKDLSANMERKDEEIRELEGRLAAEEIDTLQLRETNRSLDMQIQKLNATINELNAKLSSGKENVPHNPFSEDTLHHTFGEQVTRRQTYALADPRRQTFNVEQSGAYNQYQKHQHQTPQRQQHKSLAPMHSTMHDDSFGSTAPLSVDELNQTKTPDRRSILSLPIMKEEEEDGEENSSLLDSASFRRTFSLREPRSERRRSFQPHRYMAGTSPPERRTSALGDKSYLNMAAFATEADEPEQLDDMEWSRIAQLKENMKTENNLCDDEKNRLAELQRRNTLCLPHLRSAYPMELSVVEAGEEDGLETTIREGAETLTRKALKEEPASRDAPSNLKRKMSDNTASQVSFKKTKRIVPPPPNVDPIGKETVLEDEVKPVAKPAESFEISFTPPKGVKPKPPKLLRSHASSRLVTKSNNELRSDSAKNSPVPKKSSSTGGLKKTLGSKNAPSRVSTVSGDSKVGMSNRRLTQTLRKPADELNGSQGAKKVKSLSKVKETAANGDKPAGKSETATVKSSREKFSRTDVKRSSFSKAKTRVAASLRGKK